MALLKRKRNEEEEKEKRQDEWDDQQDAVHGMILVYDRKRSLDENYVLGKNEPNEKDFIRIQHLLAHQTKNMLLNPILTHPEEYTTRETKIVKIYAEEIYDMIMTEPDDITILNRNRMDNPIVTKIIASSKQEAIEEGKTKQEETGIKGKISSIWNTIKPKKEGETEKQ